MRERDFIVRSRVGAFRYAAPAANLAAMARPLRIEFAGALYHVMARGNARAPIFLDDRDRKRFLANLGRVAERFQWRVWAYCLMNNHYHLLLETRRPTLARGMREVNGVYTQSFNLRHGRVGHVLQGRYKALLVEKDSYLTELLRYVVVNPVRAGLCKRSDEWRWSSYRAVMGRAVAPPWLEVEATLSQFGRTSGPARRAFARFVAEGVEAENPTKRVTRQWLLGSEAFVETIVARAAAQSVSREVPSAQHPVPTLERIVGESGSRDSAIRIAYATGGYTLRQIGDHFGVHYSMVSRIVRRRQPWSELSFDRTSQDERPDPIVAASVESK